MVLPHVRHVLRHWCPFDPFQLMRGWVQEACCAALAASVLAVACELFGILFENLVAIQTGLHLDVLVGALSSDAAVLTCS